ncbi:MAG: cobyric acid synthase [Prevotella sp.]|nr:cobyric acid synthase [Prevotella sp.]
MVEKLHPIMFAGTGSDVGKSVIAAAFCRIFMQDGYMPAPFKAQNMALNSFVTSEGLEMGRAQVVQAEAAGVIPHTDMNPLLLKPQSDKTCQVILNGKPIGNKDAYDYFKKDGREQLRAEVCNAFDRLNSRYNPIVMEGAGSISEINLHDTDLVNMPMAVHANADVILIGDIDRGGVFASVYGSILLLTPEERKLIKGIIINKFRGDLRLFENGVRMLENLCKVPVLGVIPYFHDIFIEEEDNVQLDNKMREAGNDGKVNIAVVLLRHISNFTDFNILEHDQRVHLFYSNNVKDLEKADIIIIPGSKSTLTDLYELHRNGMAEAIIMARDNGKTILGICGGYQMMGIDVSDTQNIEGDIEIMPGLGLLPTHTTIGGDKTTLQVKFSLHDGSCTGMQGYEIHNGITSVDSNSDHSPLCMKADGSEDGYFCDNKCMGTYIHGILDNSAFTDFLLQPYAEKLNENNRISDYHKFKEEQYDKLAEHVRKHIDMEKVYHILTDR